MARATRGENVELGTIESIYDDLRMARSIGGIEQSNQEDLAGTISLLVNLDTKSDSTLKRAQSVLKEAVAQRCKVEQATAIGNRLGAAQRLPRLMVGDKKIAVKNIRGNQGTNDPLRYHENIILKAVAGEVFASFADQSAFLPVLEKESQHQENLRTTFWHLQEMLEDYQHVFRRLNTSVWAMETHTNRLEDDQEYAKGCSPFQEDLEFATIVNRTAVADSLTAYEISTARIDTRLRGIRMKDDIDQEEAAICKFILYGILWDYPQQRNLLDATYLIVASQATGTETPFRNGARFTSRKFPKSEERFKILAESLEGMRAYTRTIHHRSWLCATKCDPPHRANCAVHMITNNVRRFRPLLSMYINGDLSGERLLGTIDSFPQFNLSRSSTRV